LEEAHALAEAILRLDGLTGAEIEGAEEPFPTSLPTFNGFAKSPLIIRLLSMSYEKSCRCEGDQCQFQPEVIPLAECFTASYSVPE
jgi:hypothetical protein